MYHTITFVTDRWVDLETSPRHPLERVLLRAGTRLPVQLRPHVIEAPEGPIEAADLYFEDGSVTRSVPFSCFTLND
jgi:hypothetical protein